MADALGIFLRRLVMPPVFRNDRDLLPEMGVSGSHWAMLRNVYHQPEQAEGRH